MQQQPCEAGIPGCQVGRGILPYRAVLAREDILISAGLHLHGGGQWVVCRHISRYRSCQPNTVGEMCSALLSSFHF